MVQSWIFVMFVLLRAHIFEVLFARSTKLGIVVHARSQGLSSTICLFSFNYLRFRNYAFGAKWAARINIPQTSEFLSCRNKTLFFRWWPWNSQCLGDKIGTRCISRFFLQRCRPKENAKPVVNCALTGPDKANCVFSSVE